MMKALTAAVVLYASVAGTATHARAQAPARTWITDVTIVSPERLDHADRGSVLRPDDARLADRQAQRADRTFDSIMFVEHQRVACVRQLEHEAIDDCGCC